MPESEVEFKMLDFKCLGNDTVVFRLEDGAIVKVKVDLDRAGVAVNFRNPDGTPHYAINTALKITVVPPDKKFSIPKDQIMMRVPPKSSKETLKYAT
jgi:hypothetical protein